MNRTPVRWRSARIRVYALAFPLFGLFGTALPRDLAALQGLDATRQAPYTAAQAEAGRRVYGTACAACHLIGLEGSSEAPELAGPNFRSQWGNRSVGEVLDYVRRSMPPSTSAALWRQSRIFAVCAVMLPRDH